MPNKLKEAGISWVILGSQTRPTVMPRIEWVEEIVRACDKAGIPVFLKDNLKPLLRETCTVNSLVNTIEKWRQEMPK